MASSNTRTPPIRAITSKLINRTSPSVPPSTQNYEPLVKTVLRQRLTYIFFYSGVMSYLLVISWSIWRSGGASALGVAGVATIPLSPLTMLGSFLAWSCIALPVIIQRKASLTAIRSSVTSPAHSIYSAMTKPNTRRATFTYVTSALLAILVHNTIYYSAERLTPGDPKLSVFVISKKHPHYLNGRLIFLVCSQSTVALGFVLRNIMLDRSVFLWATSPSQGRNTQWPLSIYDIVKTVLVSLLSSTIALPASCILFAGARFALPLLYKLPILPILLRPFTAHFLRGSWTITLSLKHFTLLVRAWLLSVTTLLIWEFSESLFEKSVSRPVAVSQMAADPDVTLVSGVSSTDRIFKYFAYLELNELASGGSTSSSSRRAAIFGDQKNSLNLWSHLLRESLIVLGNDYQLFLRRGKSLIPSPAAAPTLPQKQLSNQVPITPTPLLRQRIFQKTTESPLDSALDSLASDGPLARALEASADAANIPELFRSVEVKLMPIPAKEEVKKGVETATGAASLVMQRLSTGLNGMVGRYTPQSLLDLSDQWVVWWKTERVSKVAEACLPSRELDVTIIEVISYLTCASLTEDTYGVVQRDIPKILEAMLSFLTAIEEYQVDIKSLYTPPTESASTEERERLEALRLEVDKAGDVLSCVGDGLKDGVARIVRTFGDKLLAFKFPPRTAQKLQGFLDYC